jgi:hypothetical protein
MKTARSRQWARLRGASAHSVVASIPGIHDGACPSGGVEGRPYVFEDRTNLSHQSFRIAPRAAAHLTS